MAWGISDLIKLLDRWEIWKQVRDNALRVPDLERRIAELEQRLDPAPGERCPRCGELTMRVTESAPDPLFHVLGKSRQAMRCSSCGLTQERIA